MHQVVDQVRILAQLRHCGGILQIAFHDFNLAAPGDIAQPLRIAGENPDPMPLAQQQRHQASADISACSGDSYQAHGAGTPRLRQAMAMDPSSKSAAHASAAYPTNSDWLLPASRLWPIQANPQAMAKAVKILPE